MRNQFPQSDRCDFCNRKAKHQSDDGADLCGSHWKDVNFCYKCKTSMVWSTTIYKHNGNSYCQLCLPEKTYERIKTTKNCSGSRIRS